MSEGSEKPLRVLVTGAARGIGRDVVEHLAAGESRILACDESDEVQTVFGDYPDTIAPMRMDISARLAPKVLIERALTLWNGLDAIVNNAGVGGPGVLLEHTTDDDVERVMSVNLLAPIRLCRTALPELRASGRGRIVNIGSLFANHPEARGVAYAASKGALSALTRSLAREEGPYGVTVNTVSPGYISTVMQREEATLRACVDGLTLDDQLSRIRSSIPMGRYGTGSDVAACVSWLLTESAGYVSGQDIPINGAAAFG